MNAKYYIYMLLISVALGLGAYFIILQESSVEQWWYWGGLLMYLLLGSLVGRLYSKSIEASNSAFYRRVMAATGLRMFFCLLYLSLQ